MAVGCGAGPAAVLTQLAEAHRLAANLRIEFGKATDAANRAVMADTDETSAASAREAEQARQAIRKDADALQKVLQTLAYSEETDLLEQFSARFTEYETLDDTILGLAVENTNLKAQRLSFGPAHEAADAFRTSLESIGRSVPAESRWRADALVAQATAAVREVQVLQAPHIAEPDEAAMTRIETEMAAAEATARRALGDLAGLVPSASRPQLAAATAALSRFAAINTELIVLSRRNSNVRSLALSLGQKRTLTAACDESLQALRDALAKRGFTATR